MKKGPLTQFFYAIGVLATIIIAIRYILPLLLKITGWLLSIIITVLIFALVVAAIIYSIAKLSEMIKR
ncbi:MAG: hypothetical protein JXK07_06045 [Spirochaetes bacterium]|nr:hypothetical protein [Spirochaetota bacterium]MBN2771439.1 hypothetical protein [Spirochaetota bacterium]